MLDVIITISKGTPGHWVQQARRTCEIAAQVAGYPVRVIETLGWPRHIGNAMAEGFAKSSAPYVAWVDDDDFVAPHAFLVLQDKFGMRPKRIVTRENHLLANGCCYPATDLRHHLSAFRRDVVAGVDLTQFPAIPNVALYKASEDDTVDVHAFVYHRRLRLSSGHYLRSHLNEAELELQR